MTRVRVPNRPIWAQIYRREPKWQDQELLEVTRETLRLALSALTTVMGQDYYHNYGAAAYEIEQVLNADE